MRIVIIASSVIALAFVVLYQIKGGDNSRQPLTTAGLSSTSTPSGADSRIDQLEQSLRQYQRLSTEQMEKFAKAQSELNASLAHLSVQMKDFVVSSNNAERNLKGEAATDSNTEIDPGEPEFEPNGEPSPPSEAKVGQIIDNEFESGDWDLDASEQARAQATGILARLPGVNLADMVCNEGLCRATFTKVDGSKPDISDVWGEPPFMNDGFTIERNDGTVVLYYAQPGVSLEEERKRLLASN